MLRRIICALGMHTWSAAIIHDGAYRMRSCRWCPAERVEMEPGVRSVAE